MKHYWTYCELCGWAVVICGVCGNNSCNGMYGKLQNGLDCHACKDVYKKQDKEWHEQQPKFIHVPRIRVWRNF